MNQQFIHIKDSLFFYDYLADFNKTDQTLIFEKLIEKLRLPSSKYPLKLKILMGEQSFTQKIKEYPRRIYIKSLSEDIAKKLNESTYNVYDLEFKIKCT